MMDERMRKELEKMVEEKENKFDMWQKSGIQLNAHVCEKFLFPYNQLDRMRGMLGENIKKYTTYFVMSCNRKEIVSYKILGGCRIDITYRDSGTKEQSELTYQYGRNICRNPFILKALVPYFEYEVCNCGTSFKVYISEKNMKIICRVNPGLYATFPSECKKNNNFFVEEDIYRMIWDSRVSCDVIEEYDLLYIGKSNAENSKFDILERLNTHSTIQKITRDNSLEYRNKEIMLQIVSFGSKLFRKAEIDRYSAMFVLGDSKWEEIKLLQNIKENQELILLIEAILICHFKPKYNCQYKERILVESKVYEKFKNENINPVSIEFDLAMDWGKMCLVTAETKTQTKMRNIEAYESNKELCIKFDDMSDYLYDTL